MSDVSCLSIFKNKMGEEIGYLGLGMVIRIGPGAPGIGVTISENFGMKMTFLMSAVPVAALVILCLFHEEKQKKEKSCSAIFLQWKHCLIQLAAGSYSFY